MLAADGFETTAEPLFEVSPAATENPPTLRVIYVNDSSVNDSGDWTTAPGDDANDGLSPATPMASIDAVLRSYELGPGDVISVDAGVYSLSETIVLDAIHSGVTIRGYTDASHADRTALLDIGNPSLPSAVLELAGAQDVTVENLTLTGGRHGIYAGAGAGSHRLTVRGTTLAGNGFSGLRLEQGNDHVIVADNRIEATLPSSTGLQNFGTVIWGPHATVTGNTVHGHGGAGLVVRDESVVAHNWIEGNRWGISVDGVNTTIHDNKVIGNASGIRSPSLALITDNLIYNNSEFGIDGRGTIRGNTIHSNEVGVNAWGLITDNQIYNNNIGILSESIAGTGTTVSGNQIHSNRLGVEIAKGRLESNLIYANNLASVRLTNQTVHVYSNTIYQDTGNGVEVFGQSARLADNILSAHDGFPIVVAHGATDLTSDYNLFDSGNSGPMALWGDREFADIETWIYELGQDRHSIFGDPRFIDPAGPDGILGYDASGAIDGSSDDDFRLLPDSPAIDAGTPSAPFLEEPLPNGGRINLGVYGNTALATPGPQQAVQVLGPVGLEKVTVGKETQITWRTFGLAAEQPVALINVGGLTVAEWSSDPNSVDNHSSSPVAIDDAVDPAPEAVYQSHRSGERIQYHLPVADGQYTLRLHLQEPSLTAVVGSRVSDIVLQGETVGEDYDILEQAGERQTAVIAEFSVSATDGQGIDLELQSKTDWLAVLSGIELLQGNPQGTPSPTVDVELSVDNGTSWTTLASDVPLDNHARGSYTWTPEVSTEGNDALIRIRANSGSHPAGTSRRAFQIAPQGSLYYVNDGNTSGDQFTTAGGDHRNSGKSPDKPMANLAALLRAYSFDYGDTIYVDAGDYTLYSDAVLQPQHSGVQIIGAESAVLTRDQVAVSHVILLRNAHDVTIEGLTLQGGYIGIEIDGSERATIRDNTILESDYAGIHLWRGSPHAIIQDNKVYGRSDSSSTVIRYGIRLWSADATVLGNTVWGFDTAGEVGISVIGGAVAVIKNNLIYENHVGIGGEAGTDNVVRANDVHSNTIGIQLIRPTQIIGNHVYSNHEVGIDATGEIRGNTVYANPLGIDGDGYIVDNRVFHNDIGIIAGEYRLFTQALGNRVYSNRIGIEARVGTLANNALFANTETAVNVSGYDLRILNNTIYQATGNAVSVTQRGTQLYNNILSVGDGIALAISDAGAEDLQSDFNLIHLGLHSNARAAFWDGRARKTLADWVSASGHDTHSLQADPAFVDPVGADGVLGYDAASDFDGGRDGDFSLQPHSPAIDRGHSWYGWGVDRDGNPRRADTGVTPAGSLDYIAHPVDVSVFDQEPVGIAQGWQAADQRWSLQLPFAFPLYDEVHTHVNVSSNGFLQFWPLPRPDAPQNREERLPVAISIAPLWANLRTDGPGNDIFIDQSVADGYFTVRWQATHHADGSEVNVAVTLFRDGRMRFDYGSGNQVLAPLVGVSRGDGSNHYLAPYSGATDLADAPSLLVSLAPGVVDIGAHEFQGNSSIPTPPRAVFDAIDTARNTAVVVDVMANDLFETELDREQLQLLALSSEDVSITVEEDGRLLIEPNEGFTGTVMFQYEITDVNGRTSHPVTSLIHVRENLGQNRHDPADVLNNGMVTPLDALSIINTLRRYRSDGPGGIDVELLHQAGAMDAGNGPFYDVNGDGVVTPLDALLVLVAIRHERSGTPAGLGGAVTSAAGGTDTFWRSAAVPPRDRLSPIKRDTDIEQVEEPLLRARICSPLFRPPLASRTVQSAAFPQHSSLPAPLLPAY